MLLYLGMRMLTALALMSQEMSDGEGKPRFETNLVADCLPDLLIALSCDSFCSIHHKQPTPSKRKEWYGKRICDEDFRGRGDEL